MTPEQANKIVDNMSEETKRELVIMSKVREMHDEENMDAHELKMTLALLLESTFPKLMMLRDKIPEHLRRQLPEDTVGLAVDPGNDDMMAGFFGGMLAVLDMTGMPAIITDENFLHMLSHCIVAVKSRHIENKIKEKANGNEKQCAKHSTQGAPN